MYERRIAINHPIWVELKRLNEQAAVRYPHPYLDRGFGALGLILSDIDSMRYDFCTPANCYSFAGTGGNGVHFSFLALRSEIDDQSPVVVTNPAAGGENAVVGENLLDFLCLGCNRRFFALEHLAYNFDLTVRAYTDPRWQPTEKLHDSVGFTVDEHSRQLLQFLTSSFGLSPWNSSDRFQELADKYHALLEPPLEPL